MVKYIYARIPPITTLSAVSSIITGAFFIFLFIYLHVIIPPAPVLSRHKRSIPAGIYPFDNQTNLDEESTTFDPFNNEEDPSCDVLSGANSPVNCVYSRTDETRTSEPRTIETRTGEPRTAEHRTGEHRTFETRTGKPRTGEHRSFDAHSEPSESEEVQRPCTAELRTKDIRTNEPRTGESRPEPLENVDVVVDDDGFDDDEDYIDSIRRDILTPSGVQWVFIVAHTVAFIVGLIGNALVCLAVYRNHSMRTVTNYFIVNLAVADFMVILFCLPPTLVWDVTSTWFFGNVLCKTVLYFQVSQLVL